MLKSFSFGMCIVLVSMSAKASCVDDIDTLSKHYGISSVVPQASSSAPVTSEKLAASGGVIAPPPTGDSVNAVAAVAAVPNPEPMQTAPAMTSKSATPSQANSALKTQAESLLMAAREAGAKGNESVCRQRLADAEALLAKPTTTSKP